MSMAFTARQQLPAVRLVAVAAVTLVVQTVFAGAGPRIAASPAVVTAGQLVEVRWSPPAGADELELLLVVADGSREPLRLTENLSAGSGSWLWRVPWLPAVSARLVLRWGVHGCEIEGQPGPPFAITLPDARLSTLTRRHGELREGWNSAPAIPANGLSAGTHASWPAGAAGAATLPHEPLTAGSRERPAGRSSNSAPVGCVVSAPGAVGIPVPVPLRE